MKGATMALGSMNRQMNLPGLTKIAMEFEKENDVMEQRQEMMDDAIDDAMDVGAEEEGEEVVEQVLEEIGVDLNQAVRGAPLNLFLFDLVRFTDARLSLGRRPQDCRRRRRQRPGLPRRLGVRAGARMTTCRRGWTASGGSGWGICMVFIQQRAGKPVAESGMSPRPKRHARPSTSAGRTSRRWGCTSVGMSTGGFGLPRLP